MLKIDLPTHGIKPTRRIDSFQGGLMTSKPFQQVPVNWSPSCLNCYKNNRGLVRVPGMSVIDTNTGSGSGASGIAYYPASPNEAFLIGFRSVAYLDRMDAGASGWDGTWANIDWGTAPDSVAGNFMQSDLWAENTTTYLGNTADDLSIQLGENSGLRKRGATRIILTESIEIAAVKILFGTSLGTPNGDVTATIETDSSGPTGTLADPAATKALTVTASIENTWTFAAAFTLTPGTYWIVLDCDDQTNERWSVRAGVPGAYSNGNLATSNDGGTTWTLSTPPQSFVFKLISTSSVERDKILMTFEDKSVPQYYESLDTATNDIDADCPRGKFIVVWKKHVFIANSTEGSSRLHWSDLNDFDNWTTGVADSQDFLEGGTIGITAIHLFNDNLYVFKENTIFRCSWVGGQFTIVQQTAVNGIGTKSPRTIKNVQVPGKGQAMLFLDSQKRLRIWNGYDAPTIVSEAVEEDNIVTETYMDNINEEYLSYCHASVKPDENLYFLWVPFKDGRVANDEDCRHAMIFDFRSGAFWPRNWFHATAALGAHAVSVYCPDGSPIGEEILITINNAYTMKPWDPSVTADNTSEPINSHYMTPKFGQGNMIEREWKYLYMESKNIGDYDMAIQYCENFNHTAGVPNWTNIMGSPFDMNVDSRFIDLGTTSRLNQFLLTDTAITESYELHSLEPLEDKIGVKA